VRLQVEVWEVELAAWLQLKAQLVVWLRVEAHEARLGLEV
jgi:hypothetical protein